jgi:hypothetical protein
MPRSIIIVLVAIGLATTGAERAAGQGDPEVTARIIEEGTTNSRAWDLMVHMSEEIGIRLTGSTGLARAEAWARDTFASYGLPNAHLRKWGEIPVRFDRGPSTARMVEPDERDFEFTARAWSAGTKGPVRGRVVRAPTTREELSAIRGDLAGTWVLSRQERRRWRRRNETEEQAAARALREEIDAALRESGIAGRIYGVRGELVVTGARRGWREMSYDDLPTDVSVYVRRIDYDAMNSRLADGLEVEVEIDLQHHFVEGPFPVFNTIAEIPGTERPDEVVIVSGHLDSWDGPGTQGAQDNATGCAVALEAARILMTVGAKPKRTIRFILWTGEEQGLYGSREYVESLTEAERAGISAVLVEDGGTRYQGGLICIPSMVPMLEAAVAPVNAAFPDMPVVMDVRERMPRGGGSDHMPFNRAGIPGFFWQEHGTPGAESKDYRFIHHTQHDIVRYAIPEYLVQSAVCSAVTAYNLAMADTLLPRQAPDEPRVAEAPSAEAERPWTLAPGPLTGTWNAELTGEMAPPDSDFVLTFEMSDDGRARGTIDSRVGSGPLERVAWDAETSTVTFRRESESMGPIAFTATVDGDTMTGSIAVNEFTMPFQATRTRTGEIIAGSEHDHETDAPDEAPDDHERR